MKTNEIKKIGKFTFEKIGKNSYKCLDVEKLKNEVKIWRSLPSEFNDLLGDELMFKIASENFVTKFENGMVECRENEIILTINM